jgi:hypothetical protein
MPWNLIGRLGIAAGALVLVISLAANPLGIGSNPREFGWLQMLGSVLGCVILAAGIWLTMRSSESAPNKSSPKKKSAARRRK